MQRFWLKTYPQGVGHDIDMSKHQSILDFMHDSCKKFPQNPAFSNFGTTLSFTELDTLTKSFAAYLQYDLNLKKGDRLAIMLPNILQYPIALFAAMRIGVVIVNVDPMYTARELIHQLNDSQAKAIIYLVNFAKVVNKALPNTSVKHVISTSVGECLEFPKSILIDCVLKYIKKVVPAEQVKGAVSFKVALKKGGQQACRDVEIILDDTVFLQYTGGTTGVSKGAELKHKNVVANVLQARQWVGEVLVSGQEKAITALPIYHIFSMTANVLLMMSEGNENILITNPRDFKGFVKFLAKTDFSIMVGVNTLFRKLMDAPGFEKVKFDQLKLSLAGGMAVTHDVAKQWKEKTGSVVVEAYGLTETSPAVCANPLTIDEFTGSIGLPLPSTDVSIKDDDGNDLAIDQPGELCVKGPQVFDGYWNKPEVNKSCFTEDGYFRTGDFAKINAEGYVNILDRKKDMILVSGFNVYPNEIEDVVSAHPDVVEAAAIGIKDDSCGEVVKLFVVKANDSFDEVQLRAYCKENLTGYKRPKEIVFMDDLPKSNVGKILRKDLR